MVWTEQPFGRALRDVLLGREEYTTLSGNVNWSAFAESLRRVHYETLRKAISGEREPSEHVIEDVSDALALEPEYFAEYRLLQSQRAFDVREVGWEQAIKNLRAFSGSQDP